MAPHIMSPSRFVSGFSPLDISGCIVWLDASDASTITKASDLVSQWNDKSGEANHIAQGTGTNQPLWVDSVQNGLPIIRFDGTDNFMDRATFTGGEEAQPTTIFIVCKFPTSSGARFIIDGGTTSKRHALYETTVYGMTTSVLNGTGGTLDTTNILLYTAIFDGASSVFYKDQVSQFTPSLGTEALNGTTLGKDFGGSAYSNIDVAEILIYNARVSAGDITLVEDYLIAKWAV